MSADIYETYINGIEYDCNYYIRAYVKNIHGVGYSEVVTTSVESKMPTVETYEPSDIDKAHGVAVLHGGIIDIGAPQYTEVGFAYSEVYQEPTIYDNKIVVEDVNANGQFQVRVTDLSSDNTYYVRAYAINDNGVVYGNAVKLYEKNWVELRCDDIAIAVQKEDIGRGDWDSVNSMCKNSAVEGKSDWRLPTLDELYLLYTNRVDIGGFTSSDYWSSLTFRSFENNSWYYYSYTVNFYNGGKDKSQQKYYQYGRCVRTLEPVSEE